MNDSGETAGKILLSLALETRLHSHGILHEVSLFTEGHRRFTPTGLTIEKNDVEKESVHFVVVQELPDMGLDRGEVFRVEEIHKSPSAGFPQLAVGGSARAGECPVAAQLAPFRMFEGRIFVPSDGDVYRRSDSCTVQGLDLLPQEIPSVERRMNDTRAGRIVAHPVVAFRKNRYAVDPRRLKRLRKGGRIKIGSHVRDMR